VHTFLINVAEAGCSGTEVNWGDVEVGWNGNEVVQYIAELVYNGTHTFWSGVEVL
jgi:hypothetical protein